uniref:PX domain-containing protein n=1 Tax=Hippocampus comes TaxID=109280 RepID=A0A3Q2YVD5_HIPCM
MTTGTFSPHHVTVRRSYAHFSCFHRQLKTEFGEELEGVELPGPRLCGWGRELQDYLSCAFVVCGHSPLFVRFLTEQELVACSRDLLHVVSVVMVVFAHPRQSGTRAVPTLAAMAVCHCDLGRPREALATAQRALPPVRRYGMRRYRAPLLRLLVEVGHSLGRPVARLQEELTVAEDGRPASSPSLKEVVLADFAD